MNKELKPCPFCGGEVRIANVFGRVGVICSKCPAEMRGWLDTTPEEITTAWNTRKPLDDIVEQLEALPNLAKLIERDEAIKIVKGGAE